ncbi:MAG: serine hydrolase [Anaerolineae bacterium]|nr:serine hydrolase [Anaerolineae bacterium]
MSLADSVVHAVENVAGVFGVAAHDWATGERLSVSGDRSFITASVIKLPILLAALDQVQRGALRLDDRIELEAGDRVGRLRLLYEFDPPAVSLHDYLTAMIVVSDKFATNLALRLVGVAGR